MVKVKSKMLSKKKPLAVPKKIQGEMYGIRKEELFDSNRSMGMRAIDTTTTIQYWEAAKVRRL